MLINSWRAWLRTWNSGCASKIRLDPKKGLVVQTCIPSSLGAEVEDMLVPALPGLQGKKDDILGNLVGPCLQTRKRTWVRPRPSSVFLACVRGPRLDPQYPPRKWGITFIKGTVLTRLAGAVSRKMEIGFWCCLTLRLYFNYTTSPFHFLPSYLPTPLPLDLLKIHGLLFS